MNRDTLYVAYGSNLNMVQMAQRCPTAEVYGVGRIEDYRLTFKAFGIYAYATIEPCKGEHVPIAVWRIGIADERCLDLYEGYPTHYTKKMIEVVMEGSVMEGMVYIMNQRAVPALPSNSYFECVLSGYQSFGFDEQTLFNARHRIKADVEQVHHSLQFYRHKRGLTQRQLAEESGVSVKSIQNYECGDRDIKRARADTLLRLAQVLEVSPYLLVN